MRRILSFHGFLLCLAGFLCACRALGLSRIISLWAVGLSARSVQRKLHPTRLRLKKHPCQSYKSVFEKKTLSGETNTDETDWRGWNRISIYKNTEIYFSLLMFSLTSNKHPLNPINPCSFYLPVFFRTRIDRIDADASLGGRYCLPDSHSLHVYNPETPSRVTLAMLGIGFQPNLPSIQLNHKTTKSQNN